MRKRNKRQVDSNIHTQGQRDKETVKGGVRRLNSSRNGFTFKLELFTILYFKQFAFLFWVQKQHRLSPINKKKSDPTSAIIKQANKIYKNTFMQREPSHHCFSLCGTRGSCKFDHPECHTCSHYERVEQALPSQENRIISHDKNNYPITQPNLCLYLCLSG